MNKTVMGKNRSSFCFANSIVRLGEAITATAITAGAASFLLAGQATCLLYSATQAILDWVFGMNNIQKSSIIWIAVLIVVFIICLLTDISRYYEMIPAWIRTVFSGALVIYFAYYIINLRRSKK